MTAQYLPARALPYPGESLTSYVRRHVTIMGYDSLRQLLSLMEGVEFPPHLNHLGMGAAMAALADFLRRNEAALVPMTVHAWADRFVLRDHDAPPPEECDFKTLLRFFSAVRPRVCTRCLEESSDREQLVWSFRPLGICIEHAQVLLDRCPGCRRPFSPARLDLVHCRCGFALTDTPPVPVRGRALEMSRLVAAWHGGERVSSVDLPSQAGFWWLDRLRSAISRVPSWLQETRRDWEVPSQLTDDALAWLAAAALLGDWPDAFTAFLEVYQTIDKHCSTSTGVGRAFGLLLRDADRLERLGYPGPAETLREYLVKHYHRGHLTGKVILFRAAHHRRKLTQRPWISQTGAAELLGVRPPTVADLVRRGVLAGRITKAGHGGRTVGVVARHSVEELRRRVTDSLTAKEAAKQLGVERHRVLEFIEAGVLADAVRTAQGWRLSQASVDELLGSLRKFAPPPANRRRWISLRDATRRFGVRGLNLVRIVEQLRAGRLDARRIPSDSSLGGLFLDPDELQELADTLRASTESQVGYSLDRLAIVLIPGRRLKDIVLRKWIAAGLLHAQRHGKAWCVATEEVARFRATYCLASEACARLGISRTTLGRWEVTRRIVPVYGRRTHRGAGASIFLRRDVEQLALRQAS